MFTKSDVELINFDDIFGIAKNLKDSIKFTYNFQTRKYKDDQDWAGTLP